MKKRFSFALVVAALIALAVPAVAAANMEPHGNYADDTDACAGCHRAHTSYSTVTWTDTATNNHSALLVGQTNFMWEFCYACHDTASQGAETNVEDGIYEGSTYGTDHGQLLGGGFGRPDNPDGTWTSTHLIAQETTQAWGAYGGGDVVGGTEGLAGASTNPEGTDNYYWGQGLSNFPNPGATRPIVMDCGTCHDPHGSPNYRLLKSYVDGEYVGGYQAGNPDPFVLSVEPGFPSTGFQTGTRYPSYTPNYTSPNYAKGYDGGVAPANEDKARGMSGWCAGCHDHYISKATTYNAGDGAGLKMRHRHPINEPLSNYLGADASNMSDHVASLDASGVPTAHNFSEQGSGKVNDMSDWVECLTCHRAHGTKATMEGFASEAGMLSVVNADQQPTNPYVGSEISALLRLNNRTACQTCHRK